MLQTINVLTASMLELVRLIIDSGWVPPRPVIFLFNGAEEVFLLVKPLISMAFPVLFLYLCMFVYQTRPLLPALQTFR